MGGNQSKEDSEKNNQLEREDKQTPGFENNNYNSSNNLNTYSDGNKNNLTTPNQNNEEEEEVNTIRNSTPKPSNTNTDNNTNTQLNQNPQLQINPFNLNLDVYANNNLNTYTNTITNTEHKDISYSYDDDYSSEDDDKGDRNLLYYTRIKKKNFMKNEFKNISKYIYTEDLEYLARDLERYERNLKEENEKIKNVYNLVFDEDFEKMKEETFKEIQEDVEFIRKSKSSGILINLSI